MVVVLIFEGFNNYSSRFRHSSAEIGERLVLSREVRHRTSGFTDFGIHSSSTSTTYDRW